MNFTEEEWFILKSQQSTLKSLKRIQHSTYEYYSVSSSRRSVNECIRNLNPQCSMFYGLMALFSNDGRSTGLIQQRVISLSCKTSFCRLSLASAEADGSGRQPPPTHASLILLFIKTLSICMACCLNAQIIRFTICQFTDSQRISL